MDKLTPGIDHEHVKSFFDEQYPAGFSNIHTPYEIYKNGYRKGHTTGIRGLSEKDALLKEAICLINDLHEEYYVEGDELDLRVKLFKTKLNHPQGGGE